MAIIKKLKSVYPEKIAMKALTHFLALKINYFKNTKIISKILSSLI
jgi:hypothetical protein